MSFWSLFTAVIRDITERKRTEEALRRSREERFTEIERVRRRIAVDLHDDIGASLTQISVLSEVARRQAGDPVRLERPLEIIAASSRELVSSMSDIVWAINPQRDHLGELIHRIRRFASDTLTARNIEFSIDLPDDATTIDGEKSSKRVQGGEPDLFATSSLALVVDAGVARDIRLSRASS